jgi:hypothetical protein
MANAIVKIFVGAVLVIAGGNLGKKGLKGLK